MSAPHVSPVSAAVGSAAAIFSAAAGEFAEHGFEGAGVDRIAARAGVNKAMLYYHYGSKRALYTAVLRDMFGAAGSAARAIADGPGRAPEKLDSWIATIITLAAARPWFPPIMLRELATGAPRLDPETFALMNEVFGAVKAVILQGQREGAFATVDPLMTHLTIMPPILIHFARQRAVAALGEAQGLAEPRRLDDFVAHMRRVARQIVSS